MNDDTVVDRSLQALRQVDVPADAPERQEARRSQVVARLDQLRDVSGNPARSAPRRARLVASLAVAAALCLAGVGAWVTLQGRSPTAVASAAQVLERSGSVEVTRHEAGAAHGDTSLTALDELRTGAASSASLKTSEGTLVSVEESTRVRVLPTEAGARGERVEVVRGGAEFSVPKLGNRRAFSVVTPHATVLVHGTRFAVTVTPTADPRSLATRVAVSEGLVEVRHLGEVHMLSAGESWSSVPERTQTATPEAASDAPATPSARPAIPPKTISRGDGLDRINDLYSAAMAAKAAGDDELAVAKLERLLARYPDSALAPSARVERFRALERLGKRGAAARAAGEHLERNRDGFAREEADAIRKRPQQKQ